MKNPALISKIKSLEALTAEEKAELIALLNNTKKYGLVWEDKPEAVEELLRTQLPVLHEVPERRIIARPAETNSPKTEKANNLQQTLFDQQPTPASTTPASTSSAADNPEQQTTNTKHQTPSTEQQTKNNEQKTKNNEQKTPNHILIEGDNLHALTALTFTHEGKIDVIYIDPPYNTGNKDFKYNDSFVDREDSYRHSKWLSFIHKRLEIAKRLLSDKGSLFISIDENEIAQLRLLCNEVFTEDRFIAQITLLCNPKGRSQDKFFNTSHEYLLVYSKSNLEPGHFSIFKKTEELDKSYKLKDDFGKFRILELRNTHREFNKQNRPNLFFPIFIDPKTKRVSLEYSNTFNIKVEPIWNDGYEGCWTWGRNAVLENNLLLVGIKKQGAWKVFRKSYAMTNEGEPVKKKLFTIWDDSKFFTEKGQLILGELFPGFNKNDFPQPKSLEYIKTTLECATNDKSTILDFFAGSGTTLHATMQLNAEDGGQRQCILVTNNENNIAEEVCYERNWRVIQGYSNSKGQEVPGLTNNNLRYYRTEFVGSAKTQANRRKLTRLSAELLQIKEDCYDDITVQSGFAPDECMVCSNGHGKYLVVVFYSRNQGGVMEQVREFVLGLGEIKEKVRLYAFSDEKEVLLDDLWDVAAKVEAVPLPDAIYNAFRATFRTLGFDRKTPQQNGNSTNEELATDEIPELDFNQTEE
jgi:adenine-specific DNA-methyltransferase